MSPLVKRSWASVGRTPVLKTKTGGNRKISVIGALSVGLACRHMELIFQVLKGENVNAIRFRSFLAALLQTLRGRITLVLDNLAVHHAAIIARFVFENRHRL